MSFIEANVVVKDNVVQLIIKKQIGMMHSPEKIEINDIRFSTASFPELGQHIVYLWGRGNKNVEAKLHLDDHNKAIEYATDLVESLKELNKIYENGQLKTKPFPNEW